MKKNLFLASVLAVLAACSNNDELPVATQQQDPITIDLQSMNYEGMMNMLSEQNTLKNVTFVDGDVVKNVSELVASDYLDAGKMEVLVFNSANEADSLEMTVTPDYIAVRSITDGQQMAYTTYADPYYQDKLTEFYEKLLPATRSGEPIVTRSANGASMKMNLNETAKLMQNRKEQTGGYEMGVEPPAVLANAPTRGWFSDLFKKVSAAFAPKAAPAPVATPTIDVYLLREKGCNPLVCEMNWQMTDAISSLKEVQSNVKFNVKIENCSFGSSKKADNAICDFDAWIYKESPYKDKNGIFVLCRWDSRGVIAGISWMDQYDVNAKVNRATLLSGTSILLGPVLAHELGHTFGADHVNPQWWEWITLFAGADIMIGTGVTPFTSLKHKNAANRDIVKKNLTLK